MAAIRLEAGTVMEQRVFKCDICQREKQQSNHWYRVRIGNALHLYHWTYFGEGGDDDSVPTKHVCGRECLGKLMQLFLDVPFGEGSTILSEPLASE
jgi:hypothetical protein